MRLIGTLFLLACVAAVALTLLPDTPLPREWNVTKRLYVSDPITPLTPFKLSSAADDFPMCQEVLQAAGVTFENLPDRVDSPQCGIEGRVSLRAVGQSTMTPVETRCSIALRLAMWERHGLQVAARRHLGTEVTGIDHFSSYSCRQIRSVGGNGGRMSLHATAEAIDISGFRLADGRRLSLLNDWNGADGAQAFFKDARDSACQWFETTLGPDYNALHKDHFHLQSRGWGTCR